MSEKRTRPSENAPGEPPARNLGGHLVPTIVAAGARKEKLRERAWKPVASARNPRPYAELRCASAFSFLDGASLPEDLVVEAANRGLPAMALVDTNGVYGAPRFYKAAKAVGVKALVGAELRLEAEEDVGAGLVPARGGRKGRPYGFGLGIHARRNRRGREDGA